MTFPTGDPLARVWQQILSLAAQIKRSSDALNSSAAAGSVTGTAILNTFNELQSAKEVLTALAETSGLADYAKAQMDDPALDIVADFSTMQTALQGVIAWVAANAGGQTLMPSMDGAGTVAYPQFTPAQTADLRTVLQVLSATIV